MNSIAVIGGGNSGLAMGAFISSNGYRVKLWNRTFKNIETLAKTKKINCQGLFNQSVPLEIVTSNIEDAVNNTDLVLITTPATAHRDLAELLAPIISDNQIVILNPGRTFGIIEFSEIVNSIRRGSIFQNIAETQTIIFTCRKITNDTVVIYKLKKNVPLAGLTKELSHKIYGSLPKCLQMHYKPAESFIETSLGNVGMILHVAPVLLNTGWIECEKVEFKYYYDGITKTIAGLIEKIDNERLKCAATLNYKIPSLLEWLNDTYDSKSCNIYDSIQSIPAYREIDAPKSLNHRYIYEDIPTGLVPLEHLSSSLNIDTPYATQIINLANAMLDTDFRQIGRKYNSDVIHNIT